MSSPEIRLLDPEFYAGDPYPAYRWLREHSPVHWDETYGIWGISRYRDLVALEKNPARYSSAQGSRPKIPGNSSMIDRDDPQHGRQRRLISAGLTPRAVRRLEPRVRDMATKLIDAVAPRGECEVVEELAAALPAMVIGDKLGFPAEMWPRCKWWSEITMLSGGLHVPEGGLAQGEELRLASEASAEFYREVVALAARRRSEPRDDLISIWANAEIDGRRMSDEEMATEALLVLDGGAETTRAVIATTVLNLIEHPDQRRRLVEDPSLMPGAVEEFIRWVSPILNMCRTATEDHVLEGRRIRAGDELLLMYASANRDEEVFRNPESYDVGRRPNHHVAFGWGTHYCIGASLARLEIRVMFEELLRRLPDMRLAPGSAPKFVPNSFTRTPDAIHVEFTPER